MLTLVLVLMPDDDVMYVPPPPRAQQTGPLPVSLLYHAEVHSAQTDPRGRRLAVLPEEQLASYIACCRAGGRRAAVPRPGTRPWRGSWPATWTCARLVRAATTAGRRSYRRDPALAGECDMHLAGDSSTLLLLLLLLLLNAASSV